MSSSKIDLIKELWPDDEFLIADGFDEAIIGVEEQSMRVVYDVDEIINILMREEMTMDEAIEYYEYNIVGAYVGEKTPIFVRKIIEL